ncbi:NUDIX hydrolase [Corynebacterium bovis]|uniref:8-oxo-dGTP diphosphatase n=4 Tax=Corynebacterium bovis TaxID=36808 RepID=A0A8I0CN01_9CORY|nr:bifunctional NUDIX hydrolase/histidine phosphatase family protein [Corynebacterium bovis]MBB3116294.1 8-oxo-dGTP diphosphatase [Corynebacterium bovis DSM 20582 = CIP 54.80]QQC47602.1 NUDIX hydrolase [Corynebacterium bovis]RRO81738.1 NTP pyrophosphohydrolase [Corynebacterium bovis]RRO92479.1 NTP pyrophosphohydrolase [Corynebacterium bovis]RRQ14407.1 NTP pyrophosphohydrolase [Corynebacterium bovis]
MITHTGTGDLSTSLSLSVHDRGHVARIGSRPAQEFARPTFAAGAVLWRRPSGAGVTAGDAVPESADVLVAMVHRPRYDDWSLPKGKVDPGENLPATAVREIVEETGLTPSLGWLLGYVHYPVGSRTKVVYYWTAEVPDGSFVPNDEVDELRWVTPAEARELATYEADRTVIDAAERVLSLGCARRVLYVRHAKAHDRQGWGGNDDLRPLTKKGRRQAEMLVSELEGYRPTTVSTAQPDRCVHTATPLAQDLGVTLRTDRALGDAVLGDAVLGDAAPGDATAAGRTHATGGAGADGSDGSDAASGAAGAGDATGATGGDAAAAAFARATTAPVSVVVSQGAVIPELISRFAAGTGVETDDMRVKKSSTWVLHFDRDGGLLGADYLASPLPVK